VAPKDGMTFHVRSEATTAAYRAGSWDVGNVRASTVIIDGRQVVGPQADAIASPSGGSVIDVEARAVLDQILAAMRGHGLIAL
jgi:hypothetical protein